MPPVQIEAGIDDELSDARLKQLLDRSEESFSQTEYAGMAHRMAGQNHKQGVLEDNAPASA